MDSQAIQEMLDNLDLQLAAGKIDLETYSKLTAKWQSKLVEIAGAGTAAQPGFPDSAQSATLQVACPECSAPLEDVDAVPGSVVRCSFCRATFTLQHARERTERASLELQRWLEQMVVEAGSGSAVDSASRRFIFGEKLFPALQLEYRRGMEPYEDVLEHPLVYLDLLQPLNGYRANEHVLARCPEAIPGVRALGLKVNSPLVGGFAVTDEDRRRLRDLDLGTTRLVHLANVANLLTQPGPEAYASAKENLTALSEEYSRYLSMSLEPGYKEYVQAIRARLEANARVLDVLATVFAPGADFASQVFVEEVEAAERELESARDLADASAYNPLAVLPLKSGLDRDQSSLRLVSALLQSYQTASRHRPQNFPAYYADLKALLDIIRSHPSDPAQIVRAIEQVNAILEAHRGEETLYRLDDWGWCDKQIHAGRSRSLLGGEKVHDQQRYWHPFWYATIRYATAKGRVFVSGVEKTGYGLLDAINRGADPSIVLDDGPLYPAASQALAQRRAGDGKPILPTLIPRSTAEQAIITAVGGMEKLRNAQVSVDGLLYVPAVFVQYESKSGLRPSLYVYEKASEASSAIGQLLSDVHSFFERYV